MINFLFYPDYDISGSKWFIIYKCWKRLKKRFYLLAFFSLFRFMINL